MQNICTIGKVLKIEEKKVWDKKLSRKMKMTYAWQLKHSQSCCRFEAAATKKDWTAKSFQLYIKLDNNKKT